MHFDLRYPIGLLLTTYGAILTIQGAIFALVRGLVERGSRHAYQRFTGAWPGDEEPEQTE